MKRKMRNHPKVRLQQLPDLEDIKKQKSIWEDSNDPMTQYRSDGKIKENGCLMKKKSIFSAIFFFSIFSSTKK